MLLHYVLPYRLSLFAFDFSGSGMSDGHYISLGVNEKHDVETVVDHLVTACRVDKIILWGHSMGAATAVMYAGLCNLRPQVKALILDSPFASFDKLAQTMVAEMPIPFGLPRKLILTAGVRAVRKLVRERANFDVIDIDPLSAARRIPVQLPALFLHGTADAIVPLAHGRLLFKTFPSTDKQFLQLNGLEHDAPRPESSMDKVHIFLQRHLYHSAPRDLNYLDQLKGRGNVAMLAGRFADAAVLYTEALNALSESLTNLTFALAVGEPSCRNAAPDAHTDDGLTRRNSSISNFVSTVKRWRHARSSVSPIDETPFRRSETPSRTQARMLDDRQQNSALDSVQLHTNGSVVETDPSQTDATSMYPESGRSSSKSKSNSDGLPFPKAGAQNSGLEMRIRPETDLDKWPEDTPDLESSRSESSTWGSRFGRRKSGTWHRRSVVESLKKKLPFGRSKTTHAAASRAELMEERRQAGYGGSADHILHPSISNGRIVADPGGDSSDGIDRVLEVPGVNGTFPRRSRSSSRVSRSSSRVHIRHRGKRRDSVRRARSSKASESDSRQERTWFGTDETKRRGLGPELSTKRDRFSMGETSSQQRDTYLRRSQTEDNILSSHGITSWNLDVEQKALVLALLGNRSLARRKEKDITGALFDAITCLKLDPRWVRGYVRKAAALREQGKLRLARTCVLEGLNQDPDHAGLTDMLQSIDIALEAEQLAKERAQGQGFQQPKAGADSISGQA